MIKSLLEIIKQLLGLASDTEDNKAKIKEIQAQLEIVFERMDKFAYGFQRLSENEAHERDKLWLRTQLALKDSAPLALPPVPSASQDKIAEILARLEALEKDNEDLKKQVAELKKP